MMKWVEYVALISEMRNVYKISVGRLKGRHNLAHLDERGRRKFQRLVKKYGRAV
jgi:hypothetical protein